MFTLYSTTGVYLTFASVFQVRLKQGGQSDMDTQGTTQVIINGFAARTKPNLSLLNNNKRKKAYTNMAVAKSTSNYVN